MELGFPSHMSELNLSDYDFDVPPELVAQAPAPRGTSRMLLAPAGPAGSPMVHGAVGDLVAQLRAGDLLVLNDTKVLKARIRGSIATGGAAEMLLLSPVVASDDGIRWDAMARPGRKLGIGREISLGAGASAVVEAIHADGSRRFRFHVPSGDFQAWLAQHGEVPLPPYVRRRPDASDEERYQTVWASNPGAVAAPTAGLHLTEDQLAALEAKGARTTRVTLHVGAGTFQPVAVENALEHPMHSEHWEVGEQAASDLRETRAAGGRIVCVGTTSLRTVETCFRANGDDFRPGSGDTKLFLHPFDPPRAAQGLLTNFHWPRTTLILLVAGWLGSRERWREVYEEALREKYRLFSYGDCMLSLKD